jgi:hypothetical protein
MPCKSREFTDGSQPQPNGELPNSCSPQDMPQSKTNRQHRRGANCVSSVQTPSPQVATGAAPLLMAVHAISCFPTTHKHNPASVVEQCALPVLGTVPHHWGKNIQFATHPTQRLRGSPVAIPHDTHLSAITAQDTTPQVGTQPCGKSPPLMSTPSCASCRDCCANHILWEASQMASGAWLSTT